MALEVLSLDLEDLENSLGEDLFSRIEDYGVTDEVIEKTRDYIWDYLDNGNVVSEMAYDAAKYVLEERGIEF